MSNTGIWDSGLFPEINEHTESSYFTKDDLEFLKNSQQKIKTTLDLIKNTPRNEFVFSEPIDINLISDLALSQHLNTVIVSRQMLCRPRSVRCGKKQIDCELISRTEDLYKLQGMQYDLIIINEPSDFTEYEINYIKFWNLSVDQAQRCLVVMFDSKKEVEKEQANG
ncbi:MAG: hypothetical protein ACRC62_03700 [Microcoleus sp.]